MDIFLIFLLSNMLVYGDFINDPVHAQWFGRQASRNLECERLTQAEGHERNPGAVPAPSARGTAQYQIDVLDCRHRVAEAGLRKPRDELILRGLSGDVEELTGIATSMFDDDTRWIVDAYYPDPLIVHKIVGATRVALAERGRVVSDAPPRLTAGDVEVLRTVPMRDAIRLSCRRLAATGALTDGGEDDNVAFLAVALLHEKESQLHAGVCHAGEFRWLR